MHIFDAWGEGQTIPMFEKFQFWVLQTSLFLLQIQV